LHVGFPFQPTRNNNNNIKELAAGYYGWFRPAKCVSVHTTN
jgi:hypothetical protein